MVYLLINKRNDSALCVPRSCLSNTAMLSADISEIENVDELNNIIDNLSEVIAEWNSTKFYKANGGDKRIYGNCQEFIDSVII
jgi:hypothetical protein